MENVPEKLGADKAIIGVFCKFMVAFLSEYKRCQDQFREEREKIVKSFEIFIQGLMLSGNLLSLNFSSQLVIGLLDLYAGSPENLGAWLKYRREENLSNRRLRPKIRSSTPSVSFTLQFFGCTVPSSNKPQTFAAQADLLFNCLLKVLKNSSEIRKDFCDSNVGYRLLEYPLNLATKYSSRENKNLNLNFGSNGVQIHDFIGSGECKTYLESLSYFVKTVKRLDHKDLELNLMDYLLDFFLILLRDFSLNESLELACMFFKGITIFSSFENQPVHSIQSLNNIFESPHFEEMMWSCILCYSETETSSLFHASQLRKFHSQALEFLLDVFASQSEIIQKVVYEKSGPQIITDTTDWLVEILYSTSNGNPEEVSSSFWDLIDTLLKEDDDQELCTTPFFKEILLVRTNIFFLCTPEENRNFLKIFRTVLIRTKGRLVQAENSDLSRSLAKLFAEWKQLGQDTECSLEINSHFLWGTGTSMESHENNRRASHWIFFWNDDVRRRSEVKGFSKENKQLYSVLIRETYCLRKYLLLFKIN
ncbi:DEKNAAC105551 [Brettanomyces naardenensis]|uniref:DEKNAAC105551 n=1 Tax=Brettanomyces naardenensis TaxID=13370 RepID=A0A448YTU8_BRENA|nr:DEKNAAC105551 [Brettanomyces naardenensis]